MPTETRAMERAKPNAQRGVAPTGSSRSTRLHTFDPFVHAIPTDLPNQPGRPAPVPAGNSEMFECSASRDLATSPAAPNAPVTRQVRCYIPVLIDNDHRSAAKINRQPRRLEIVVSHRKQTTAPPINRKQFATSQIRFSPLPTQRQNSLRARCYMHRPDALATSHSSIPGALSDGPLSNVFVADHVSGVVGRDSLPVCRKTTQCSAPICCVPESDIMISRSGPKLLSGNLWRITEWFN